jgi:ABC-2 type transport system permease protein
MLSVVSYLSTVIHFENIAKGIVDTRDILYFLSLMFMGLYATHLVMLEKK